MQIVGDSPLRDWMQELYDRHGMITPALVLEAARPDDSPAHAYVFGVPLGEAAEQFYLGRAHELIRRVKVQVIRNAEEPPRRVRFWHAIPGGPESAVEYHSIETLARQTDMLERARNEALRRLRDAERSVEDFDLIVDDIVQSRKTKRALTKVKQAREALAT